MPTTTSFSCTSSQNGSNSGSANDRGPRNPGTGAGRTRMILAPRSVTHSSSSIAFSTIGSVITGVAKMRSSKLKVHVSCIHSLRAWITTWIASGSSRRRSSTRLARVGHISARSSPSSSISSRRGPGSRNAGGDAMALPMISRRVLPSGLPCLKYSSCAPGAATFSKVGLGMYSLMRPFTAIFVRPSTWMYCDHPRVALGQELGERVRRLVHVVVGVEDGKVELARRHGRAPWGK